MVVPGMRLQRINDQDFSQKGLAEAKEYLKNHDQETRFVTFTDPPATSTAVNSSSSNSDKQMVRNDRPMPYELHIRVNRARRLRAGDVLTSDPYARVILGGDLIATTKVISTTLNPVWDERFVVPLLHPYITLRCVCH